MRYFIGGYTWNKDSQLERFINDEIWENGYEEEKYSSLFAEISVGDYFALKSTFVKGRKPNAKSFLRIKAVGKVIEILNNYSIKIKWLNTKEFDLTDIKWYANTLEEVTFWGDINRIFGNIINHFEMENYKQLLKYKKQIILQGPPGTGKTREAKLIAKEILGLNSTDDLKDNEQFKLIQFHPSYTYEDFVRGIVAESKGDKIEYKNVNKTLGEFAELALKNYNDSKKNVNELSTEKWIDDEFTQFVDEISQTLEKEKIVLSDNVDLVDLMDDAFLYIGENWKGYEAMLLYLSHIQS
jgi:Cdc6-like AAA superfamily ATPase